MMNYQIKSYFFTLLFLFFLSSLHGNSTASNDVLSEVDKLSVTCKVWGFLKYYHPNVAKGKFDWDKELFDILPEIKNSVNKNELSEVLLKWIESLGTLKPCKKCKELPEINYFNKNFNLSWINNKDVFTKELSMKLSYIENNRHLGKKYYVDYFTGKPKAIYFQNEKEYPEFDWKNENLTLLSLFRFWNMVEYFFPAKYQMDKDWDDVLAEIILKFKNPKSAQDFYQTMTELVVNLDDSHAFLLPNNKYCNLGCLTVPVEFKIIDTVAVITKLYDSELAKLNNLKVGDILTEVNGQKIKKIFNENKKYINGSNESRKKINAGYYLLNGSMDTAEIKYLRNKQNYSATIKRYPFKDYTLQWKKNKEKFKLLDEKIGYVDIGKIDTKEVPKVMSELNDTKAIIFDFRKTKGSKPFYFANYISSQKKDFYKAIFSDLNYPGKFIWSQNYQSGDNKLKYKGKVILLVDEYCQSQMEFSIMLLQTGNDVVTIGRKTSGANGNIVKINLPGGLKTRMTGTGIFYPNGKEAQREGVKIDIYVQPNLYALAEGKDEILERAIKYINNLE